MGDKALANLAAMAAPRTFAFGTNNKPLNITTESRGVHLTDLDDACRQPDQASST